MLNDSIVFFHLTHQQYTTFVPMLYAAKTDSNLYRYGHMYFQTVFVTVSSVASRTFASSSLLARRPSHQPPYGITSSRPPSCCLPLPSAPHSPTPTPPGGGGLGQCPGKTRSRGYVASSGGGPAGSRC